MRGTAGLKDLVDFLFYESTLQVGLGTSLSDRKMSVQWQALARDLFPTLQSEPEGLLYPVLLDVSGESMVESEGGTSHTNPTFASIAVDLTILLIDRKIARAEDIGIIMPYAGQVDLYIQAFSRLGMDRDYYAIHWASRSIYLI